MPGYDGTFKILLVSGPEVDKSGMFSGCSTYISQSSEQKTPGLEFRSKSLVIDKKKYKLQIWDLGGEERFRFLLHQYCKGANAAFFLYDITKSQTLNSIGELVNIVRQKNRDIPIILIGIIPNENSNRQISAEEGIKIANARNLNGFIEINAKTGENVGKAYETITRLMIGKKGDFKVSEEKIFKSKKGIKTKVYEEFRVYDLENTGDRTRLNIKPEELQNHLNPKKVLIIIREDLRRIFIWKGAKAPVRKRFIAARVAQDLQRELIKDARYQRCKIISIDQGDELQEFLNAFGLESMEVTERLPDMRYIRKSELDRWLELERLAREKKDGKVKSDDEYYSSGLENILERELKGRESYRDRIITLLSKIQRFWDLTNSRIIAVTLVQGSDTILYSTDNWDIRADVGRVISGWNNMSAPFIMLSGVKYSVLNYTPEILIATSMRGEGHILGAKDEDYTLILHVEPDGDNDSMVYPYIFTPPNPPDDFEMAPQVQLRAPLKEKDPEAEIFCQYCGRKLTKEEQLNHSCKKKP